MPVDILYFAWVREQIGVAAETVSPPASVATVGDLVTWLSTRGHDHAEALSDLSRLRAAADARFVGMDHAIAGVDEVAIFPPVTGG